MQLLWILISVHKMEIIKISDRSEGTSFITCLLFLFNVGWSEMAGGDYVSNSIKAWNQK